jgi:hypothetical protein
MIGVINALLFEFVEEKWGADKLQSLNVELGFQPDFRFRQHRVYDDAEWASVYEKTIAFLEQDREQFEWEFGFFSGEKLITLHHALVADCKTARDVILRQPRIHHGIADAVANPKEHQGITRKFRLEENDSTVIMHYRSANHMCTFYRSLATFVAQYFGETVTINEPGCMKHGADECEIHLDFSG